MGVRKFKRPLLVSGVKLPDEVATQESVDAALADKLDAIEPVPYSADPADLAAALVALGVMEADD